MTTRQKPAFWVEIGLLGCLALLWGSSYLFTKVAVTEIPPLTLTAMRVSIGGVFLLMVVVWRGQSLPRGGRTWRRLSVQSLFNSIAPWTLLAWGQQHVDSGLASVLNSTSPIWVFLLTLAITRHEPTTMLKLLGACLGLGGVVLIVGVDALAGLGLQVGGQLAAVAGAVLYGGAAIYGRRFAYLPATVTAAGTMILAMVVLVPVSLVVDRPWTLDPSWRAFGAALALGVGSTGLALLIYFRLIRTLGSLGAASQAYLRAGVGVVLGMVFLGEQITLMIGVGLIAAVLGVALINSPARPERTHRP